MPNLAIKGGRPLLAGKTVGKSWPVTGDGVRQALISTLDSGIWCYLYHEDPANSQVGKFERAFAQYQGSKHGCAVTNGTTAIEVALRAGGVQPGDEVIVPAASYIATAMAPSYNGAVPVLVDIDAETYTLVPEAVESAITARTKAIIPVHLGGYPADMEAICRIAEEHDLLVIEDCAHVHGTVWDGHKFPVADMGVFSFQQRKTLTAGEGGMVLTDSDELAANIRSLSNCGRAKSEAGYDHQIVGTNLRMTEFQGALLLAQLADFDEQIKHADSNGIYLAAGLEQIPGLRAMRRDARLTQWGFFYWTFKFLPEAWDGVTRNQFVEAAQAEGLPVGPGGLIDPMYLKPVYADGRAQYRRHDCPNCEYASKYEALNLPHQAFLGEREDMDLILAVFTKIWDNRQELNT